MHIRQLGAFVMSNMLGDGWTKLHGFKTSNNGYPSSVRTYIHDDTRVLLRIKRKGNYTGYKYGVTIEGSPDNDKGEINHYGNSNNKQEALEIAKEAAERFESKIEKRDNLNGHVLKSAILPGFGGFMAIREVVVDQDGKVRTDPDTEVEKEFEDVDLGDVGRAPMYMCTCGERWEKENGEQALEHVKEHGDGLREVTIWSTDE